MIKPGSFQQPAHRAGMLRNAENTPEERHQASMTAAHHAVDAEELAVFLSMLGLGDV